MTRLLFVFLSIAGLYFTVMKLYPQAFIATWVVPWVNFTISYGLTGLILVGGYALSRLSVK